MLDQHSLLKDLPAVDRLMREAVLDELQQRLPRQIVLQAVQQTIAAYRSKIIESANSGKDTEKIDLSPSRLALEAAALAEQNSAMSLQSVINATGVIIHTNLGRVPLSSSAVDAIKAVAEGYSNLEMTLATGERGSRQEHLESLLVELSGAEAAVVVNNNAAAVFLVLNTFASGREVIVSRGQLVEIGGSFRIPEIITAGGAQLIEVGTTNKTYRKDYEAAINEHTAVILKVHTSNYHLVGFTAAVKTAELTTLAHENDLLLVEDLGSGVFIDLEKYSLPPEPRVQDSIAAGADLVTFSGDKMLGGPQAGIIVGRRELVSAIRKNQLARVLRVDKFTVAALEATLHYYRDEEAAINELPVWKMLTVSRSTLLHRAQRLAERFSVIFGKESVQVIEGISRVGGGALPEAELPTYLAAVTPREEKLSTAKLVELLRMGSPPVILRLQHDSLLFDPRTIIPEQEEKLFDAVNTACIKWKN